MKKLFPLFVIFCLLLTGCGFAGESYRNYVTAILDTTYHNKYEVYQELTGATVPDADGLFRLEANALGKRIRDNYSIRSDKITPETCNAYTELAENILKKTKYTVRDVMRSENHYTVVLVISPIDFWQMAEDDIKKYYYSEFLHKFRTAPTQADADRLEEEYAFRVLEILKSDLDYLNYLDAVVYTCNIENNTVSAQDWEAIDKLILNLS